MANKSKAKTGECFFRDEEGALWLSESFEDENGIVESVNRKIDESGKDDHETSA